MVVLVLRLAKSVMAVKMYLLILIMIYSLLYYIHQQLEEKSAKEIFVKIHYFNKILWKIPVVNFCTMTPKHSPHF